MLLKLTASSSLSKAALDFGVPKNFPFPLKVAFFPVVTFATFFVALRLRLRLPFNTILLPPIMCLFTWTNLFFPLFGRPTLAFPIRFNGETLDTESKDLLQKLTTRHKVFWLCSICEAYPKDLRPFKLFIWILFRMSVAFFFMLKVFPG